MPVNRKLAAIVFADVVGYSRLMEHDEAGTHARFREIYTQLVEPRIAGHGGRVVRTAGDGILIEFPSATSALRCAVEVQRQMATRNLFIAAEERIEFRVGINLGDIIIEGDDIAGDGVNVAARLEALATPGGICVSSAVREQVHEDLGIEFVDAGEQLVKNISKPIRTYHVTLGKGVGPGGNAAPRVPGRAEQVPRRSKAVVAAAVAAGLVVLGSGSWFYLQGARTASNATLTAAGPTPRSIMIVPFSAPPGDPALTVLAEALPGDVSRAFANSIRDVRVVSPTFAKGPTGSPIDVRAIGRDANVRYLVESDVRVNGEDIVVTARLVDAVTTKEIASERRSIARARITDDHDLLVVRLAAATRAMFWNAERRRIAAEPTSALDARGLVERADAIFTGEDLASAREARKLLDEAIRRDPSLVAAYVGRFYTLDFEHVEDLVAGRNEQILAAMESDSRRAVTLDERDAWAWDARSRALAMQWRYEAAFEASDRAQVLDPTRFNRQLDRGWLLIYTGRSAEALKLIEARSARIGAPDSEFLSLACHVHVHLAQYEQAIAKCGRAVAAGDDSWMYLDLTVAYALTGDMVNAAAAKAQLMRKLPDLTLSRIEAKQFSNNPIWISEMRSNFIAGLRKAGVPE